MAYEQRTANWVIDKAYLHANRKAVAPASGTTKYQALLGIVDSMQKLWESEPNTEWDSLYSLITNGTVTATDTFELDDEIASLSRRQGEYVQITNGTSTSLYQVVSPDQLYQYKDSPAVAKIGRNLKFSTAFKSDSSLLGYSIKVPAITFVNDITVGTDLVQVDDPMWLVYMTAAEFVRNDIVKRSEYDSMVALANNIMEKMKQDNIGGNETVVAAWQAQGADW